MRRTRIATFAAAVGLATFAFVFPGPAPAQQGDEKDIAAARAVLQAQEAAWNRGDVAGYMDGYAREDSTTFISGDTITRGWQTVLERYKAHYDTRDKMGRLAFSELEFAPLCPDYIKANGRWQLTTTAGTPFSIPGGGASMRIKTRELGIDLKREGRQYLEYAVFGALRQFVPSVDMVSVCLRRNGPEAAVTCVMVAELLPSGRAVAALRARHPYAAIDRAAAELRNRIGEREGAAIASARNDGISS